MHIALLANTVKSMNTEIQTLIARLLAHRYIEREDKLARRALTTKRSGPNWICDWPPVACICWRILMPPILP